MNDVSSGLACQARRRGDILNSDTDGLDYDSSLFVSVRSTSLKVDCVLPAGEEPGSYIQLSRLSEVRSRAGESLDCSAYVDANCGLGENCSERGPVPRLRAFHAAAQ